MPLGHAQGYIVPTMSRNDVQDQLLPVTSFPASRPASNQPARVLKGTSIAGPENPANIIGV